MEGLFVYRMNVMIVLGRRLIEIDVESTRGSIEH